MSAELVRTARARRSASEWLHSPELGRVAAAVAAHYGLSPYDRAEVLQETRIAIWRAAIPTGVTAAWIFRVATNKAIELMRRATRYRTGDQSLDGFAPGRSPEPDLEHLLRVRVAQLPGRLREFYALRYQAGWSERELAHRLGRCRASIRWLDGSCQRALIGQIAIPKQPIRSRQG